MCADQLSPTFYTKFGMTADQWNAIGAKAQEICKANPKAIYSILGLIENGTKPEELAARLANNRAERTSGVGTEVEKKNVSQLEAMKPKVVLEDMENKDMREASQAQWKEYFEARYKANPTEAKYDIARVIYRKEVAQVQAGLNNMLRDSKQQKVVKAKYLAEGFASNKEVQAYNDKMKELKDHYKNNTDDAIRDYNALFRVDKYNDPVDEGGHLTAEQMDALIRLKGLDAVEVDGDRLRDMAVTAVANSQFSKGVKKANEYLAKAEELKGKGATPESRRIMQEAIEQDAKYDKECAQLLLDAQTPKSIELFNQMAAKNKEAEAEIAKQKRLGNMDKAAELEKQLLKDKAETQKAINAAMDQDKLNKANELSKKRLDARLEAEIAAFDALDPKIKQEISELQTKAEEAAKNGNTEMNENVRELIPDMAAIMAEAQVDKQRAEARFNRTTVHWGDGKTKDDGKTRNTYLDDEMRQFVLDNPKLFCDEVADGEGDFYGQTRDENGNAKAVSYKFNEQKFQDYMLRLANDNQLDNADANDPSFKADYYATIAERKEVIDARNNAYGTPAKLKDRKFAKKCYEAAGLDLEKDKTVAKRWGNLAKKTIIGAGVGGGVALLTEYLNTTRVVELPFFKVVEYAGSVPFVKMIPVKGTTEATLTGRYQDTIHVEGDQAYHQDIEVSGVAEGDVTLGYSGTQHYTQDYTQYYSGSKTATVTGGGTVTGTVSGTVTGDYSGVASKDITVSHTNTTIQNGVPIGSGTWNETVNVNIPYEGQVSIPYEQGYTQDYTFSKDVTVDYDGYVNGTVEGDVAYSGTTTGKAQIPYKQVVSADGTVHWVADVDIDEEVTLKGDVEYETEVKVDEEVQYKGEKEINDVATGKPKMNWGNVTKGIITGAIGGAATGLMDWNKIYDEGGRQYGVARQALSEKGVDAKPAARPEPAPITPPPVKIPVAEADLPDHIDSPIGAVVPPDDECDDCSATAEKDPKSIEPVETFQVGRLNLSDIIAKKYGITDRDDLYDAVGVVKGWHGISEADRHKNIYIAELGLRDKVELDNDKVYNYVQGVDRKDIDPNTAPDVKGEGYGRYARVEVIAGKVTLSCDGSVYHYDSYDLAVKVADFYNKNKRMPDSQEMEQLEKS